MTVVLLMRAIKAFIEAELVGDVSIVPAVHIGFLPHKTREKLDVPEFPCIIVRALEGSDEDSSQPTIKLFFGVETQEEDGFLHLVNLMERVRIALLRKGILDNRYRLERPYKWKVYEEQADPVFIGEATTTWTMATVLEEVPGI
jgi:hypothetical protein